MNNTLAVIAAAIVAHHYWKHPELSGLDRFYQVSDWNNPKSHEFYVNLALIGAGVL